jgi:N-acetylglucosamine-6-phosphate deacetylase
MRTIVTASQLWDGQTLLAAPILEIEDGTLISIGSQSGQPIPTGKHHIHFPSAILAPSFFDIHIHGAANHDVMEATPEALATIRKFLASRGTANFLATTVTAPIDATLRSLNGLAKLIEDSELFSGAKPLGIHLEGPFISHAKRGVHPPDLLLSPNISLFDRFYEAANGHIRLMTLAPELPGAAEFAAHAISRGVRISMGHSNATAAETNQAIAAGATSATHTFNAMRPLDHREPGILGTVLSNDDLYAELICDGIHVDPALVKLWWRAKGPNRAILITDGMAAGGMGDGEYMLGGFKVQVANGKATANGILAGSVLTLDRALTNFMEFTSTEVAAALPLLTKNPATMAGFTEQAGTIQIGQPANFVALSKTGALQASVINGQIQPAFRHN